MWRKKPCGSSQASEVPLSETRHPQTSGQNRVPLWGGWWWWVRVKAAGVWGPLAPADDDREELRPPCDLSGLPMGPTALVRVSIPVLIVMNMSNLKKDGLFHLSL